MARGLTNPVFTARLAECEQALSPFVDWSLSEVLAGDLPERVDVVQPALWAVMVALAAMWEAAGVTPSSVIGHSQGEIAAACVAGMLSLSDGARVVALRSKALAGLSGGMTSVALPADEIEESEGLWVAAINGRAATVVSGEPAALTALEPSAPSAACGPGASTWTTHRTARSSNRSATCCWTSWPR